MERDFEEKEWKNEDEMQQEENINNSDESSEGSEVSSVGAAKVFDQLVEEELKSSYLGYAMSVIVGRALPDVRDGLKPVHRRILYGMNELGLFHNKTFKKSARIVGEVLGKFHPHGDSAVYDAMVRMAQTFSLRYPLVNGQGNFGSVDGDSAAAMRYTEAKLAKIAEEMLADIDKDTVDFSLNFDGSLEEPTVLPSKFPNLLVNGSSGIAVGMATNIPPHNLGEIIDGTVALIDDPELPPLELNNYIKGPDFPTGGTICGTSGIRNVFEFGRGKIKIKPKSRVEEKGNKKRIIVTEIPYQVNKANLIEEIADKVKDKTIEGISDLRDESDRDGMRIVIELKKDVDPEIVLNQLQKYTRLSTSFGVNSLALVDNVPKTLPIKDILEYYIVHRKEVVVRRTKFEMDKAEKKCHLLEGLIIALDDVDNAIALIKKSDSTAIARDNLMSRYELSKEQAQAILDMKLQKLTSMEQEGLRQEHANLKKMIEEYKHILANDYRVLEIIKEELLEIRNKYADERKTEIDYSYTDKDDIDIEDLIEEEQVVVSITKKGYIKRLPIDTYRQQKRGGRGIIGQSSKEDDWVEDIFVCSTHAYLLFLTNKGRVHWLKVYKIPEASRTSRGKAIVNFVNLDKDEFINTILPVREFKEDFYLILSTQKGLVKKTDLSAYSRPRQGGIIAISLEEGDSVIDASITDGSKQIILATQDGSACKFFEKDVRPMGRASKGVRGIRLRQGDNVVNMIVASDQDKLLTVTEHGYGKRTRVEDYRLTARGGKGVRNILCSERNGKVINVKNLKDEDDFMVMSKQGIVIRVPAQGVSVIGRNTQGVRLMKLANQDQVVAVAKIANEDREVEE